MKKKYNLYIVTDNCYWYKNGKKRGCHDWVHKVGEVRAQDMVKKNFDKIAKGFYEKKDR